MMWNCLFRVLSGQRLVTVDVETATLIVYGLAPSEAGGFVYVYLFVHLPGRYESLLPDADGRLHVPRLRHGCGAALRSWSISFCSTIHCILQCQPKLGKPSNMCIGSGLAGGSCRLPAMLHQNSCHRRSVQLQPSFQGYNLAHCKWSSSDDDRNARSPMLKHRNAIT